MVLNSLNVTARDSPRPRRRNQTVATQPRLTSPAIGEILCSVFRSRKNPPLILLVEDDPTQIETASFAAFDLGLDFDSAATGSEALDKLAERPADVVLLNIRTPDLSGYEACRRIKTAPETASTQILFVTSRVDEEDLLPGFEALANDYVAKPFSGRELKARIKSALRTKDLLDALTARTRFLELQQEITEKLEDPDFAAEGARSTILGGILDRVTALFLADGATLHTRSSGRSDTRIALSTTWPGGDPPVYIHALALAEDPRIERPPRMPGETRESGSNWAILSAPLWVASELVGTIRLHREGALPRPGDSSELEHLVALADHLARTLHRAELMVEVAVARV